MYSLLKIKGVQKRLLGSWKVESGSHLVGLLLQLRSNGWGLSKFGPWPLATERSGAMKERSWKEGTPETRVGHLAAFQPLPLF